MKISLSDLRAKDQAHHLHPFTDHAQMHETGTRWMKSGEGVHLVDERNRRLLDGLAGLWCVNVGYNCPAIVAAVSKQMERLPYYPSFFNSTTEPPVLLADWLSTHAPPRLSRCIFSNSGSEANETALKIIRQYYERLGRKAKRTILTRDFSYHGVTLATASMTGLANCSQPFGLPLDGFVHAPAPYPYAARTTLDAEAFGAAVVRETARIIEREGAETIAAMFVEPVQGAGGVIVPPPGYLRTLRDLCHEKEILFVADEVITAFGRLGAWFASDLWELDPDLITLAKGITSGYLPLGATMVSDEIVEVVFSAGYFAHGFTYSSHPVCAAAALANLQVIEDLQLVARVREDVGPYLQGKLAEFRSHPAVGEVRGCQLIGAIELVPREGRDALTPQSLLGFKAADLIRDEGAIVRGIRDLVAVAPALIITRQEIDELCSSIRRGLDRLWD